jgi:hypothetical protein
MAIAGIAVLSPRRHNGEPFPLPSLITWYLFMVFPLAMPSFSGRCSRTLRCANCWARPDHRKSVLPIWSIYLLILALYLGIIVLGNALRPP